MGLFVVGRIAGRHGIRVGLRGPAANETGSGTTAEIYLPPTVLTGLAAAESAAPRHIRAVSSPSAKLASAIAAPPPADDARRHDGTREPAARNAPPAPGPSVTLLPRRNPGSSGITDVPAPPAEPPPPRRRRELATPWWENAPGRAGRQARRARGRTGATTAAQARAGARARTGAGSAGAGGIGHLGLLRRPVPRTPPRQARRPGDRR
ncbi:hypothetical protein L843_4155 [Mycobacterium intracellulare MIN_061107_1834]|nr:hypothetical protein L843_4155 [Mycobacterium intracellulare MIN_061107_1834]